MACLLTSGYPLQCKSISGVYAFYISNWTSNLTYTLGTASPTLNQITTFTAGTSSAYTFYQTQETGSMINTGNSNIQNGTIYYDQAIEFTLFNPTQTLIDIITLLGQGRVRVIVQDNNGNYFQMGLNNPMEMSALTGGLGKAYGDLYGYTITITGKEKAPMVQITTAAALSVIS